MFIESEQSSEGLGEETSLDHIPTIESEEELANLLGQQNEEKKPVVKKKPIVENQDSESESPTGAQEEGEEGEENEEEGEAKSYPSILHYLNDEYGFKLNLNDNELPTKEEEAQAVGKIIENMTAGVNNALKEYQYIDVLLQDPEVKQVLEAKQAGKSLKDVFAHYATTQASMSDDELALNDFKKRYPKAPQAAVDSMIKSLKDNGQFTEFTKSLRELNDEEQRLSSEAAIAKAQQDEIKNKELAEAEVAQYTTFVGGLKKIYGVPLTDKMRADLIQASTQVDEEGMTYLDHALQSNEGTALATLGILYLKDMIKNGASLEGNRKNAKFIEKIFEQTDQLQSSSADVKREETDMSLLNNF